MGQFNSKGTGWTQKTLFRRLASGRVGGAGAVAPAEEDLREKSEVVDTKPLTLNSLSLRTRKRHSKPEAPIGTPHTARCDRDDNIESFALLAITCPSRASLQLFRGRATSSSLNGFPS
jgi:hypothetical protein